MTNLAGFWATEVPEITERQWSLVEMTDDCWLWKGHLKETGYGIVHFTLPDGRRTSTSVHRYFYANLVGPLGADEHVDHLCRVRNCVNPDHLEAVTPRINAQRREAFRRPRNEEGLAA